MNIYKHIPSSIKKVHKSVLPINAKNSIIYTKDKKYVDFTSGIGALSTGHNHPHIIRKVSDQLERYVHMPQQVFQTHPIQIELTEKIIKTMPDNDDIEEKLDNIFYVNSGSEAIENAIKIARLYTGKSNIITMNGGFHGRSLGALSVTSSNVACRSGVTPLMSNVYYCNDFTKKSLDVILEYQSGPTDTAAILLESIQGERGIYSIDVEFLEYIRYICDTHNILLIADEIQCGAMRAGSWWNITSKNIIPDLMTFGKGIASGYPLAGVIGTSTIMNSLSSGNLGGTYGGNAICSAAASATIDILNNITLQNNINYIGTYIKDNLENEVLIKEIRQHGLMIAFEFTTSDTNPDITKYILEKLREEGILVLFSGNRNQYIRILPCLTIEEEYVYMFIEKMKMILNTIILD